MKILILNGPNLNLLGRREPGIYGNSSLKEIMDGAVKQGKSLHCQVESFQSNEEGALITRIGQSSGQYDGIIINPAGYTHTSVALRDAILACGVPCVEVHLSNTLAREEFRHASLTAGACVGQVMGFGAMSYHMALSGLVNLIQLRKKDALLPKKRGVVR